MAILNLTPGYTDSLDRLVTALCADYLRRDNLILGKGVGRRTEMEFRYLNFNMLSAAEEVAGEKSAEHYIKEIGERVGYAKSCIDEISETTYKQVKLRVKLNIARRLHLID